MFLHCNQCGNLLMTINDSGNPVICCGEVMRVMEPQTDDSGLGEKHVPVYELYDKRLNVCIGSVPHPSTAEHHIEWIYLETECGGQLKYLKPGDEPKVCFKVCRKEKIKSIYAYCNLHGLWAYHFSNTTLKGDQDDEKSS